MKEWDFSPPPESDLGDREVSLEGEHLKGKRIALLISGSIAAMKAPLIARALRKESADVIAFASQEALRYTTIDALEWSTTHPVVTKLTAAAEHLSDRAPFDLYLLVPATYNTINKMRHGIADGVVTSALASALGRMERGKSKIAIAPAMHGSLHNAILTESLKILHKMGVRIIPPREAYGKHNLPEEREIVVDVCRFLSDSPLKNVSILVTGGPTPVPIDNIRRLTNHFSGRLGTAITEELYLRGADVRSIHGEGTYQPPAYLPYQIARTYQDYSNLVIDTLSQKNYVFGIFSAAVADYQPEMVLPGKTPSGGALKRIDLVPTPKVIERVKAKFPQLRMVTFKYQEGISHDELMQIAQERINRGYSAVIANRGEEMGNNGEQIAYLVTTDTPPQKMTGKKAIAIAIANYLEGVWHNISK